MSLFRSSNRSIGLIVIFTVFCATIAQAQVPAASKIWTTVGSAGTVDDTDGSKVTFDHGTAQVGRRPLINQSAAATSPAAPPQAAADAFNQTTSAVIRYNLTPVDGLFVPGSAIELELRYLDVGRDAQVIVELIEADLANGTENIRVKFDSNTLTAVDEYRVQTVTQCTPRGFNFSRKGYYLNATLTSNAIIVGSAAGIQMIKVKRVTCPVQE